MAVKTVEHVDVAGRRVLIRVDFNVPLKDGAIEDDGRVKAAIPTISSVVTRGGRAILLSHLGRPKGTGFEKDLSLRPVAGRLSELMDRPVGFPADDCLAPEVASAVSAMSDGDIILLENLRFHKGEKAGDKDFASKLAAYGDVYVNDAFASCHRNDASMVALPHAMAGKPRVIGLLVAEELRAFDDLLAEPRRPYVVALGGAKVADKIGAVNHLLDKADAILIGGAMAYTFCKALGKRVGDSRVEENRLADAKRLIDKAAQVHADLHLPADHVCSTLFARTGGDVEVFTENIKDGFIGLDIGPATQTAYTRILRDARTIAWNGPMGVFEWAPFSVGTQQVAGAIAEATKRGASTLAGGGDTAAAVRKFNVADQITHVSTGGGASLALLSGQRFESVDILDRA